MKIAVIGAGIHGSSAARLLAERGHDVTLYEAFPIGHTFGSSHGSTRIIRRAYHDPFYTACMAEAYSLWRDLERDSGQTLLSEIGLLWFGEADSESFSDVRDGLRQHEVPHEEWNLEQASSALGGMRFRPTERAIFTPEAGFIWAAEALKANVTLAAGHGAKIIESRVRLDQLDEFEHVIVAAGPWNREFWPELEVRVTLQAWADFGISMNGPVWVEDTDDFLYGFPTLDGVTKAGVHRLGPSHDPADLDRTPPAELLDALRRFRSERFGLDGPLKGLQGCLYTSTANEDFRFWQPDSRTTFVSGCSGHGFKFGPWVGKLLADLAEGQPFRADLARLWGPGV